MAIRRKQIKHKVAQLIDSCAISKPPVDVSKVARSLGLEIVMAPDEVGLSGFLISDSDSGRQIIGVNQSHHINRRRFTIAHEIGHHVMGHLEGKIHVDSNTTLRVAARSSVSSKGTDPHEVEANSFAAELLMPQSLVEDAMATIEGDSNLGDDQIIAAIAKQFKVSESAMSFRLANLGLS